jgi:para-nitrobenzyl esterase
VQPWRGVRDATTFRYAAVSHRNSSFTGLFARQPQDEDCLTLNVSAPAESSATPRAVMVFIHGGGFFEGSSAWPLYDPKPLVERGNVVVVTINYRLNGFGYIDLSDYSTPERQFDSNLGLRDQVAALEWVRRNIRTFGGDPNNVTIFGESAGGIAVTTLLATPSAAGLFHRAIAQSTPADVTLTRTTAATVARQFISNLGASEATAARALESASAESVRKVALRLLLWSMRRVPGQLPFGPVVDGEFLPETPLDAFASGRAQRVPLIIGTNRGEMSLHGRIGSILPTSVKAIDRLFEATDPTARDTVLAAYPGLPLRSDALQLGTDCFFLRPTLEACESHSKFAPTYLYRFDFVPPLLRKLHVGAFHGLDLIPVFGVSDKWLPRLISRGGEGLEQLRAVTDTMQGHWLNFAKTGAPLASWSAYGPPERNTLLIDTQSRTVADPSREVRLAWERYKGPYRVPVAV